MTEDALAAQDFDSIISDLPAAAAGELQKAKCKEFVKKLTHNGTKAEVAKISGALASWLKFMKGKMDEAAKNRFKEAFDKMLALMNPSGGKIQEEKYLSELSKQLSDTKKAQKLRADWLRCWSDMFSACDKDGDDRLVQEEAETLLLAFNVPQEFSEPLFDLLCDEFEEKLNRRAYIKSMNEYFFTDDRNGIFGQLFSDRLPQ